MSRYTGRNRETSLDAGVSAEVKVDKTVAAPEPKPEPKAKTSKPKTSKSKTETPAPAPKPVADVAGGGDAE